MLQNWLIAGEKVDVVANCGYLAKQSIRRPKEKAPHRFCTVGDNTQRSGLLRRRLTFRLRRNQKMTIALI
jgi:hypothetical protein